MGKPLRIALLSDIHGNRVALDAVLADIDAQGGADEYWVLGDLVAFGPQPNECMDRISKLPNVRMTRGNTDRYIMKGDRPPPSAEEALDDPERLPILVEVASSCSWTLGMITAGGWFDTLNDLPLEERLTLPNGTRLLGVHASPGKDGSDGIVPDSPMDELISMFTNCDADLVCVGHTHWPANRYVEDVHVINLGSVSNSRLSTLDATYVLLDADESGYKITHRFVPYDQQAVIQLLEKLRHPGRRYINLHMRGELIATYYGEPEV